VNAWKERQKKSPPRIHVEQNRRENTWALRTNAKALTIVSVR